MSNNIIKQIIKEVIQEQMTAFRQIRDLDEKFPWFSEVIMSLSDKIASSNTQVTMDDLGDGYYKISFTGPPDVLLAIQLAMDGRYVSGKRIKPENPWDSSTIEFVLDSVSKSKDKED